MGHYLLAAATLKISSAGASRASWGDYRQIVGSIARIVNVVEVGGAGTAIFGSMLGSIGIIVIPHLISGLPLTPSDGRAGAV